MAGMVASLLIRLATSGEGAVRRAARNIRDLRGATEEQRRTNLGAARAARDAASARQQEARGAVLEAAALAYGFSQSLRPAIEFESAMADVGKVIDFTAEDSMPALAGVIKRMSTEMPVAASGIADIVASLGQAGLVSDALSDGERIAAFERLARRAAQASVAFGISAKEAGDSLANFQAGAGLSEERVAGLLNTINHLSDNMNATAPKLLAVTNRMLTVGLTAGATETEFAALATAMLQSGAGPEIVGTALKNMLGALGAGENATKSQLTAMDALGLGAVDLARRMHIDFKGGLLEVIEGLRALDDAERGPMVAMLFGEEGKAAIMPLIANMDGLTKAFGVADDTTRSAGSMLREYQTRLKTTDNALQLMTNGLNVMAINIGTAALPRLRELAQYVSEASGAIAKWAEANPAEMETVVDGVGLVLAALVGTAGLRWAFGLVGSVAASARFAMMLALGNPVIAAVGAVATAVLAIYTHWDNIVGAVRAAIDAVKEFHGLDAPERGEARAAAAAEAHSRGAAGHPGGMGPSAIPMPGRASGGPVRAGALYEVNERGQELFAPGRSGSILTAASVRAALGPPLRTASGSALGRGAGGGGAVMGPVAIHVHPPAGASVGDIAAAVRREVEALMRDARMGGLHDGAALA